MPNTYDICDKLNSKVFNKKVNELDIYHHFLNFEKELTNYLLDKLISFKLESTFVTIEKDIPTIILYINELLHTEKQKKAFFYNITLYLVQYISIIFETNHQWLLNIDSNECYKVLYAFEYIKNTLNLLDDSKTYTRIYQ